MGYLNLVKGLYVAKYVVQNSLWNGVIDKSRQYGYDLFERGKNCKLPVVNVNFYDCVKFCNALNQLLGNSPVYFDGGNPIKHGVPKEVMLKGKGIRLPFVSEWEGFATKENYDYFWGNDFPPCKDNPYAWYCKADDTIGIQEPGLKQPNPYGLYDVLGNVCQWCFDTHENKGEFRVLKGGSVSLDSILKIKFNAFVPDNFVGIETGFRIVSDEYYDIPSDYFNNQNINYAFKSNSTDFFELLNKDDPKNHKTLSLWKQKLTDQARRVFFEELATQTKDLVLPGYMRLMPQFIDKIPKMMKLKGTLDWFNDHNCDLVLGLCAPKGLIEKYHITGDFSYLEQWFYIAEEHAKNFKNNFYNMTEEQLKSHENTVPYAWFLSQGFDTVGIAEHITNSIVKILQITPLEQLDDKKMEILAQTIVCVLEDFIPWAIKDGRYAVPNQVLYNAMNLILVGKVFSAFKIGKQVIQLGYRRFCEGALENGLLPDGGDMEQSFNYNHSLANDFLHLLEMFDGKCPLELESVREAAIKRVRFLKAIALPFGGEPASGTSCAHYPPPLYNNIDALKEYCQQYRKIYYGRLDKIDNSELDFTSVFFPYTGVSVLRNSWEPDAVYMCLFGFRQGNGHASENVNSFTICAYGMPMIVNAGASWYGNKSFVPSDQLDIMPQIDQYKRSALGENTLLIDQMGQGRLKYGENGTRKPYKEPINMRFYTDDNIDFAESAYEGIYVSGQNQLMAQHKREVIFLKHLGIFIIIDKAAAKGQHLFTLTYHIMPEEAETRDRTPEQNIYLTAGYKPSEISVNGNRIYTTKQEAPNFEMITLGNPSKISLHTGQLNPALGWFGGAIRCRRHKKTDVHISWKGTDNTKNITVISCSKTTMHNINIAQITKDGALVIKTNCQKTIVLEDGKLTLNGLHLLNIE